MKRNSLIKGLFLIFAVIFTLSCNDTLDQVGFTIQPGKTGWSRESTRSTYWHVPYR